ncbi:hypothetical protein [Streptomyces sp. NPDC001492]
MSAIGTPRRGRTGAVLLVLVALAATVAWALSDRTSASPQPSARTGDLQLASLRSRLPLSRLLHMRPDASRRIHGAEQRLVADCMATRGFDYTPAPAADASPTGAALFGIESLDESAEAGVGEPPASEQPQGEGFDRALYGDPNRKISAQNKVMRVSRPATGCLAEAQTRLLGEGGRTRDLTLRMQLDQGERDTLQALQEDPAFGAATARWRDCMADGGITAKDPRALAGSIPRGTDPVTQPAVRADVRCKQRTGYLTSAYTGLAAMQQAWLDAHPEPAAEWQALHRHEDGEARKVLADS